MHSKVSRVSLIATAMCAAPVLGFRAPQFGRAVRRLFDTQKTLHLFNEDETGVFSNYLPLEDTPVSCDPYFQRKDERAELDMDYWFMIVPAMAPILAYFSFESVSHGFTEVAEFLSSRNWIAVDGGGT